MSSNREYGKERRSRKNSKKRNISDFETSRHYEHKAKKMFSKDKSEKYKRYDSEEDFYT
jgi:hypothetical protein